MKLIKNTKKPTFFYLLDGVISTGAISGWPKNSIDGTTHLTYTFPNYSERSENIRNKHPITESKKRSIKGASRILQIRLWNRKNEKRNKSYWR